MICAGREFDDGTLSWDDLYAFIFAAPPNTAVFHAIEHGWTTTDHLLASILDAAHIANWQRTEDATKKFPRNTPKRTPRPTDEPEETPQVGDVVSVGGAMATVTTVGEFMARRQERERRWRERHNKKTGGG